MPAVLTQAPEVSPPDVGSASPGVEPGSVRSMGALDGARKFWASDDAFAEHRLRTSLVAVGVGLVAVVALVFGPSDSPKQFTTVWTTVWSAVLSLALITLIYELSLRQSHARALRKFIRLNSSVVRSGLEAINEAGDVEWRELFRTTSSATFVLVGPFSILPMLNDLFNSSRGRVVTIRICLPDLTDPADTSISHEAAEIISGSIGADERLRDSIASSVDDVLSAFDRRSGDLAAGSMLEIALYTRPAFMEGVLLDDSTVLMPIEAGGRPRGAPATCLVFADSLSPEVERLREGLLVLSGDARLVDSKEVA